VGHFVVGFTSGGRKWASRANAVLRDGVPDSGVEAEHVRPPTCGTTASSQRWFAYLVSYVRRAHAPERPPVPKTNWDGVGLTPEVRMHAPTAARRPRAPMKQVPSGRGGSAPARTTRTRHSSVPFPVSLTGPVSRRPRGGIRAWRCTRRRPTGASEHLDLHRLNESVKSPAPRPPNLQALGITCPAFRCGAVRLGVRCEIVLNHNALRTALVRSEQAPQASNHRRMAQNIHQLMRASRRIDVVVADASSANEASSIT
jgi:hypothetical protein